MKIEKFTTKVSDLLQEEVNKYLDTCGKDYTIEVKEYNGQMISLSVPGDELFINYMSGYKTLYEDLLQSYRNFAGKTHFSKQWVPDKNDCLEMVVSFMMTQVVERIIPALEQFQNEQIFLEGVEDDLPFDMEEEYEE